MLKFAFFDVDETLVCLKSMLSFQEFWCATYGTPCECRIFRAEMRKLRLGRASREVMNRRYYAHFAGRSVASVRDCAVEWFRRVERDIPNLFNPGIVARLLAHRNAGEEPVLVSGSFPDILAPVAARLGVTHVLCTRLVTAQGQYTGEIRLPQMIGAGKARAVRDFLFASGTRAAECYAYGDDISDRFMLAAVGHPVAIAGHAAMESHAKQKAWPIIDPVDGNAVRSPARPPVASGRNLTDP
ncbi:MAG: HAD-IB family hydrolase [Magnetospirillum sp.]|nr:HAD-IB family hydrolase [Magnetospirillum sp.]